MSRMIVITRNGKTVVLTGWRAWIAGASAFVLAWLLLGLVAFIVIGVGLTFGILLLLAVPAVIGVALVASALNASGRPK